MRPLQWLLKPMGVVGSTQRVAFQLAEGGAPEGTVVTARRQTSGRGRTGRTWVSPEGGLYMSVILRRTFSAQSQLLPLIGALAVVKGIASATGLKSSIKWPNDVLIHARKVAGVLSEASYSGRRLSFAVLGIGLNCNSMISSFGEMGDTATTLLEESGRQVDISVVRDAILESFGGIYEGWLKGDDVIEPVKKVMSTMGARVTARTKSGAEQMYSALDLDCGGGLVVVNESKRSVLFAEDLDWLMETKP